LKQLRGAKKELRSHKSLVADLQRRDTAAHGAVKVAQGRRKS
jgi:hypothetical protein